MKKVIKSLLLISSLGVASAANAEMIYPEVNLVQAVDKALKQNQEILAKEQQLKADREQINQAWSQVNPQISFNASAGAGMYEIKNADQEESEFHRASLSMVLPLYVPQNFARIERAEIAVDAAETQFSLDGKNKALEVTQAYMDVLKFTDLLNISDDEIEDHEVKILRLKALLERGLTTKMDLLEANSRYDILKANRIKIMNDLTVSKTVLERLLSQNIKEVSPMQDSLWQRSEDILANNSWLETAYSNYEGLLVAKKQADVAKADIKTAQKGYHPELFLRGELSNTDTYETVIENNHKIQLELSFPLYEGGITDSEVAQARAVFQSKQFLIEDQRQFIQVKLDEVLARMQGGVSRIKALEQSVESNKLYVDAAEKGLQFGLRGVFDVLEAKARLYESERNLKAEKYDNMKAQFEFLYLIGRFDVNSLSKYVQKGFSVASFR